MNSMLAAYLPGNSSTLLKEVQVPEPGYGQVLIKMKASTICGSDIRAIYREHLGKGPEAYQNVIAGHEPCGQIIKCGSGLKQFKENDRVIIYHISGCGICYNCRRGYMVSCLSEHRKAYGWQRDGGMAEYCLADEKDLILLPDELSYLDGAQVSCGFGTVYEGLEKCGISGNDAVLVVGLGPVGLATLMLCKSMGANKCVGVDLNSERLQLALDLGLADAVFSVDDNLEEVLEKYTYMGKGFEKTIDCSGAEGGRLIAIKAAREWGSIVFIGEGNTTKFEPSPDIIHGQKTIYGSWVTSIWKMQDLVEKLVRWGIHPEKLITNTFSLENISEAYALMDKGACGKVAITFN